MGKRTSTKGPAGGVGAKARGSHAGTPGGTDPSAITPSHSLSIPAPDAGLRLDGSSLLPPVSAAPEAGSHPQGPSSDAPESFLEATRGVSVRNAGIDPKTGKVIPHSPSSRVRALVSQMVAIGHDVNEIAVILNVRPGQLKQHYGKELAFGKAQIDAMVGGAIIKKAVKGDARMAIFYAKAKMDWRDGDGKPVDISPFNLHIHL